MADRVVNVLFLCTHNSARSIMAEALLNKLGGDRFKGYSAGSFPKSAPNPFALEQVAHLGFDTQSFHSKSWDAFAQPGAPMMDIVITVCDDAASETCPVWPALNGKAPAKAHWGLSDPSDTPGGDDARRHAFARTFTEIQRRIERLVAMDDDALAHPAVADALARIHRDAAA